MRKWHLRYTMVLLMLIPSISICCQDSIFIDDQFTELKISAEQTGFLSELSENFNYADFSFLDFKSLEQTDDSANAHKNYFKFIIVNTASVPIDISISKNLPDTIKVFTYNQSGEIISLEKINIRGLSLYGRVQVLPGNTRELYIEHQPFARRELVLENLQFRLFNYNNFLEQELPSRFVDSLLIGLLLFSAILNLILGIILKRKSFISLFFYLMSLSLFAFSFLGFYDEFIISKQISLPIGLPLYFLTLILFLQVSKRYLLLEKYLPGWKTVTNVIMFFLILSIPYYYLTVYIERLYNSFLAFSSLFFFVVAAGIGVIESIILFRTVKRSKFFLVANLLVVLSLVINIFLENKYPVVVGSVIQGFIFTIGLAEEIKFLDKQKIRFQQRYIKQLEVNLKLKDNLTSELEQKVQERTQELKITNNQLLEKNKIVEQQKELLFIRNREIKDSIEYAKRIQNASFPSSKILHKVTRESFILYKPRDIVSGDFYWFGEVDNKVIIIAADCTGHGVPGAFMSMYGIAFLNEIINKEKIYKPNEILNSLRDKISGSLNRSDNEFETMDGMDMSLLTFDPESNTVLFGGANNPLYLVRDGEILIYTADKMPVAYYQKMDPFQLTTLEVKRGDCLYIFSDGIIDQFGGELGKKFLSKRLKDVLTSIAHLNMDQQKRYIEDTFLEWKGDYFQVDDILMVGMRI